MRGIRLVPWLVPAVLLAVALPARAGGWDAMLIRGSHVVGDEVTARTRFVAGELDESGPLDGRTYHAYLLTESRDASFEMIHAPSIPDGAIDLGEVLVLGPVVGKDDYPYGVATISFTVPDVPSGAYPIGFCDDPCTYSTIGWLAWGRIRIVHTPFEGQVLHRLDRATTRISRLEFDLRRAERATEKAHAEIDELGSRFGLLRPALPVAEPAVSPTIRVVEQPVAESSVTWWVAALAAVIGLGLGAVLARRRTEPPFVIPDTVPDELDERVLR